MSMVCMTKVCVSKPASRRTPLYQQVLGDAWDNLSSPLQSLHQTPFVCVEGRVTVTVSRHWLARLLAACLRLPRPCARAPATVRITHSDEGEHWERRFAGRTMASRQWLNNGQLHESFAGLNIKFACHATPNRVILRSVGMHWLGIPLPSQWQARIDGRECHVGGKHVFRVSVFLPLLGRLLCYHGYLEMPTEQP